MLQTWKLVSWFMKYSRSKCRYKLPRDARFLAGFSNKISGETTERRNLQPLLATMEPPASTVQVQWGARGHPRGGYQSHIECGLVIGAVRARARSFFFSGAPQSNHSLVAYSGYIGVQLAYRAASSNPASKKQRQLAAHSQVRTSSDCSRRSPLARWQPQCHHLGLGPAGR